MGFVAQTSTWAIYLNRKMQRARKMKHKLKERTFMEHAQVVVMQQRRKVIQRIIGQPMLIDPDVELGLQLSPLITPSKGELSLIRLLDTYEMAKAMASECHHADFRSLMLVSKRVRFAAQNCMSSRILKRITCTVDHHRGAANKVAPTGCWGCGNQICSGCASPRSIPRDKAFHLQGCFPFCSPCFRSRFCRPRKRKTGLYREWRSYLLPDACFGHGTRPIHSKIQFSGWSVPKFELGKEFRDVCSLCKSMSWEEIAAQQGWMGWTQNGGKLGLQQATKATKERCEGCKKFITTSKGQKVWWGCKTCDSECADEFHDDEFRAQCHGKPETGPAAR